MYPPVVALAGLLGLLAPSLAHADSPWLDGAPAAVTDDTPRPLVGFQVRGDSKVTSRTLRYLARATPGELVTANDLPRFHAALLSSELFKTIAVTLERSGDGVILVATVDDKHSWIIVPTLYVLSGYKSVGLGFAENNLAGENRKLLLYAQLGDLDSFFFGTYLDPSVRGTRWTMRFDLYPLRRRIYEFANPTTAPGSIDVARETTLTFLNAGILVGYNVAWWLTADARLRGAYVYFRDAQLDDGTPTTSPEIDGWDVTMQGRITIDRRDRDRGVARGGYLQLTLESSIPGLDTYGYQVGFLRAYYNFRLFSTHHLEFRASLAAGRHLPLHEELALGGPTNLRGYLFDQFRGDTRVFAKAEYSVPVFRYRWLAFRALGFVDTGAIGYRYRRPSGRDYLSPTADAGAGWWRNDVGGGMRVYLNNIVLPLLGFDIGYGLERKETAFYLQVGLTDF
ncbi:MAG: BamA/TamA family outer membrane protein [Deltaproteobacteria bacterium]|nr:BamA/TamA family outer membrane protein [Deltaproteobacteria bacterium]